MNGHGAYDEDSGLKLITVSAILVGEVNGRDAYDEGSEWARPLLIGASAGRERESMAMMLVIKAVRGIVPCLSHILLSHVYKLLLHACVHLPRNIDTSRHNLLCHNMPMAKFKQERYMSNHIHNQLSRRLLWSYLACDPTFLCSRAGEREGLDSRLSRHHYPAKLFWQCP